MKKHNIQISNKDYKEVLKTLGYENDSLDESVKELLLVCESQLREVINACFVYRVFDYRNETLIDSGFVLEGETIKEHLDGYNKCACLCATLGGEVDALIRKKQVTSMAEAMMIDKMASFLIEKVCDLAEDIIMKNFDGCDKTFRYGLGYGDFPIEKQKDFLDMLEASKQVGVYVNEASMLMPTKSVTCLIGIKDDERVVE